MFCSRYKSHCNVQTHIGDNNGTFGTVVTVTLVQINRATVTSMLATKCVGDNCKMLVTVFDSKFWSPTSTLFFN